MINKIIWIVPLLILLSGCFGPTYEIVFVDKLNIDKCTIVNYINMSSLDQKYSSTVLGALKICDSNKCCVLQQSGVGGCRSADCVMLSIDFVI